MSARFEIKLTSDDQFVFSLIARNGQVVLTSERYARRDSAHNGIASVKTNSSLDERFERLTSSKGDFYFVLKAANHHVIGQSEMYSSKSAMERGIASVKKIGPTATVEDQTAVVDEEPDTPHLESSSGGSMSVFKKGDRGSFVLRLQQYLNSMGFDAGAEDAEFGEQTEFALKAFQASRGMQESGITGHEIFAELGIERSPLLDSLPESTSLAGRSYHHIGVDSGELKPGGAVASQEKVIDKTRPGPTLQVSGEPPTLVQFGTIGDLMNLGRPTLISMWIRPVALKGNQFVLFGLDQEFEVRTSSNQLMFEFGKSDDALSSSASFSLVQNEWRHLAVKFTALGRAEKDAKIRPRLDELGRTQSNVSSDLEFDHDGVLVAVEIYLDHGQKTIGQDLFVLRDDVLRLPLQLLSHRAISRNIGNIGNLSPTIEKPFVGALSQVEIWHDAREVDVEQIAFGQLRTQDPSMRLAPSSVGQDSLSGIRNSADSPISFQVSNSAEVQWTDRPEDAPPLPSTASRLAFARSAITEMLKTGVPNPVFFDNPEILKTPRDAGAVRKVLNSFSLEELEGMFAHGHRFRLRPKTGGGFSLEFALPNTDSAGIVVVEQYALTSFVGKMGRGRLVQTLSLAPGESSVISVNNFKRTESTKETTESILDSVSDEASQNFESSLKDQQTSERDESSEFAYHAEVSGQASWSWGSVQARAGVSGSIKENRRDFQDSISSVVRQHASTTSSNREITVSTTTKTVSEEIKESSVVREIQNINLSKPLTTAFYQVNQEAFSLLHLVDLRVGFFDAARAIREEVRLEKAGEMLEKYLTPTALRSKLVELNDSVADILADRKSELVRQEEDGFVFREGPWSYQYLDERKSTIATPPEQTIKPPLDSEEDQPVTEVTEPTDDPIEKPVEDKPEAVEPELILPAAGISRTFNRTFHSIVTFHHESEPGTQDDPFVVRLPGLVVRADRHVMRTDSLVCESILGDGWGLDAYSTRLQEAEATRLIAEADKEASEARLVEARAEVAEAIASSKSKTKEKVDDFTKLEPRVIPGATVLKTSFGSSRADNDG